VTDCFIYWRSFCQPIKASLMKFTSVSGTMHQLVMAIKQWSCFVVRLGISLLLTRIVLIQLLAAKPNNHRGFSHPMLLSLFLTIPKYSFCYCGNTMVTAVLLSSQSLCLIHAE